MALTSRLARERQGPGGAGIDVRPAPVLELGYAFHHLLGPSRQRAPLPWQVELAKRAPDWVAAARANPAGLAGYEALLLACAYGYAADDSPERFLADLPTLPGRLLGEFDEVFDPTRFADGHAEGPERVRALRDAFAALRGENAVRLAEDLGRLWEHLGDAWRTAGRQVIELASRDLLAATAASGDLVASLPAHHFVNFEDSAADIRAHREHGSTFVAPLYFASRGGFKFLVRGTLYLGYGVRSEDVYEEQKEGVMRLAGRVKAFADPTRLLLLFQIARLSQFPLTVGDLARQLGVTQPTASGHLRLLRELELVQVVKRGNRSYYRVDREAVRGILADLEHVLLP